MKNAVAIFDFLLEAMARGEQTALVTVTDVVRSGPRSIGTHMAVSSTGRIAGSLSNGCIDRAVAAEAQKAMATREAMKLRVGVGSPYIDLRLPCGGGLDLLITPNPSISALRAGRLLLDARRPVGLALSGKEGAGLAVAEPLPTGWRGDTFHVRHDPDLRLLIFGQGLETVALAKMAHAFEASVEILSSDEEVLSAAGIYAVTVGDLRPGCPSPHWPADAATAAILLFHDHDWEGDILAQLFEEDAFMIGAMGSRASHARRLAGLKERGISERQLASLIGPIGLIPTARDPRTLAVSILSQVVALYEESCARGLRPAEREMSVPDELGRPRVRPEIRITH